MAYANYLKTFHWMKMKNRLYSKYNKCFFCGSKDGLNIHHRRYKNKKGKSILFREREQDLLVICRECHKKIHDKYGTKVLSDKFLKVTAQFVRHNKMDLVEVFEFLDKNNFS